MRTSDELIDKRWKELLRDAKRLAFDHHCDILDCSVSMCRQRVDMDQEKILRMLSNPQRYFVHRAFILRDGSIPMEGHSTWLDIGLCVCLRDGNDHFIFNSVETRHLGHFIDAYDLEMMVDDGWIRHDYDHNPPKGKVWYFWDGSGVCHGGVWGGHHDGEGCYSSTGGFLGGGEVTYWRPRSEGEPEPRPPLMRSPLDVPRLWKDGIDQHHMKMLVDRGMLAKASLRPGDVCLGQCRNAIVAKWEGDKFIHWRSKFGSVFEEHINHPEDDDGYDLFVPIAKLPAEAYAEPQVAWKDGWRHDGKSK